MKKWLALLLAAMMALALVACGDTPANNDNDNKDNDTKTEEFARGSWDGNVYTNDSIGLTVTVPAEWSVATDEELAMIMGIAVEAASQMQISEEMLRERVCYDMMAVDLHGSSSILITAVNMDLMTGDTDYDEKAYAADLINQLQENNYTIGEEATTSIGERDYYVLYTTSSENGINQDYFITKIGSRMVSIVIAYSPDTNDLDSMLAMLGGK